jgi:multicomponent Na+:H+ antiporter subunit A
MELVAVVLAGFMVACIAPWVVRLFRNASGWVLGLVPLAITFYLASLINQIADGEPVRTSYDWIPSLNLSLSFSVDGLSLLFAMLISGIGTLVVIYSGSYLAGHHQLGRFYCFLLMFMGSMLGIVLSDNVLTLFVFWELTSITSFLLIGFNHKEKQSRISAAQAFIVTVLGGQAMLGGLLLLGHMTGTYQISEIVTQAEFIQDHSLYLAVLLLLLGGAFAKSAQVPLHFWLPNAMEAPTPVSAYLHSATMVKAGVYLLARFQPALGGTEVWEYLVGGIGALTMLTGALLAFPQSDLKRLLAYSTISALGTLVMLIGIGTEHAIIAAMVFLLVHSLYKAALFLVAGIIDHETGTRDVGLLGGLRAAMPITAVIALLAAVSMAGLPPLYGFIGKELIYEAFTHDATPMLMLVAAVAIAANVFQLVIAGITGIGPFIGQRRKTPKPAHDPGITLWIAPAIPAMLGVVLGLVPAFFAGQLIQPASEAVAGYPVEVKLSLWHGLNPALAMSFVTVVIGIGIFLGRGKIQPYAVKVYQRGWFGSERAYQTAMRGLNTFARNYNHLLQHGYLRYYLLTIIGTAVVLAGYPLLGHGELVGSLDFGGVRFYEYALALMIVSAAFLAARSNSRLGAVAALGAVGYGTSVVYIFNGAPDLAMTQVLVETLMAILLVLVFYRLPRYVKRSRPVNQVRDAVVAISVGAMMTTLVLITINHTTEKPLSDFFEQESVRGAHSQNIVNAILVDFRALDTMGEITVLSIAAVGVYALMRLRPAETPALPEPDEEQELDT